MGHPLAQILEDVVRGLHADIGRKQPGLQLLEDFGIDLAAPEQGRESIVSQELPRLSFLRRRWKNPPDSSLAALSRRKSMALLYDEL